MDPRGQEEPAWGRLVPDVLGLAAREVAGGADLRRTSSPNTEPNKYLGNMAQTLQGGQVYTSLSVMGKG